MRSPPVDTLIEQLIVYAADLASLRVYAAVAPAHLVRASLGQINERELRARRHPRRHVGLVNLRAPQQRTDASGTGHTVKMQAVATKVVVLRGNQGGGDGNRYAVAEGAGLTSAVDRCQSNEASSLITSSVAIEAGSGAEEQRLRSEAEG